MIKAPVLLAMFQRHLGAPGLVVIVWPDSESPSNICELGYWKQSTSLTAFIRKTPSTRSGSVRQDNEIGNSCAYSVPKTHVFGT